MGKQGTLKFLDIVCILQGHFADNVGSNLLSCGRIKIAFL